MDPACSPVLVGENFMDKITDFPGLRLSGKLSPLTAYPVVCTDSDPIFIVCSPTLVIVTAIVRLLPTVTFPKLADDGLKINFPAVVPPNAALVTRICPSALPVEPIIASSTIAILTTIRNCALRSLWLLKMVSGETAKKLSGKNDGRGRMESIQRSLYAPEVVLDTEQESRLRAKPSVALMGRANLSFGPLSLCRILAVS